MHGPSFVATVETFHNVSHHEVSKQSCLLLEVPFVLAVKGAHKWHTALFMQAHCHVSYGKGRMAVYYVYTQPFNVTLVLGIEHRQGHLVI